MILIPRQRVQMRFGLTHRQLTELMQNGQIPFVEVPGIGVRFDPAELRQWIEQHRHQTHTRAATSPADND